MLAIVVNYNCPEEVKRFIANWQRQLGVETLNLIVVDNSPNPDGSPSVVVPAERSAGCTVLVPGKNLGYFGAAAWSCDHYQLDYGLPEWTIVTNPDIELPRKDFVRRIGQLHGSHPPAVLAPSILSVTSNRDENPFMASRPSAIRMQFYKWIFEWQLLSIAYHVGSFLKLRLLRLTERRRLQCVLNEAKEPEDIYAPHGAFIVFHRSYFEAGGHLRHGTFLFGEEIFVAESARRSGGRILYDPRLRVVHRDRSTTGIISNRRNAKYLRDAARYLAEEFFAN